MQTATDAAGRLVEIRRLEDFTASDEPRPGSPVTVYRPFSILHPLDSLLAWRIREYSGAIAGSAATESHAMLYLGGGLVASQDRVYRVKGLEGYKGCTLSFYEAPFVWEPNVELLLDEARAHEGREYGYLDLAGQVMRALTGRRAWVEAIGDQDNWICSEALCRVVRKAADPEFGGGPLCDHTPEGLGRWMIGRGWPVRRIKVVG